MDAAAIHRKIYAGRGKAALRLGLDFDVYRPALADDPLTHKVASIKAAFNAGDNNYSKPNMPGDSYWHGDFDGRMTQPGDYLAGEIPQYFIAAQQQFLPILVVECNAAVSILRTETATGFGAIGYGGLSSATLVKILGATTKWPSSILTFGQRDKGVDNPASAKEGGFRCLLPSSVPVQIRPGDIVESDKGLRYLVQVAEFRGPDSGWRLLITEKHG